MAISNAFRIEADHRVENNFRLHSFFSVPNVKPDTVKKAFVISCLAIMVILAVGATLMQAYPTSAAVAWGVGVPWIAALAVWVNSMYILVQAYDILPSCMYKRRPGE